MLRLTALLLTLYSLPCVTMGQKMLGFDPADPNLEFTFNQWNGENGLVSNNITSVIQSKSGFLWMTTYNGLMRYDGNSLDIYDRTNYPFLHTDAFYRAYEDEQGVIWLASQGSGIVKIVNDSLQPFLPHNKLLPLSIRSMAFDKHRNVLWVGTNSNGLLQVQDSLVTKLDYPPLNQATILSISVAGDGTVWIATDENGVISYDGDEFAQFTAEQGLATTSANAVWAMDDGSVWVGTDGGLNRIVAGRVEKKTYFADSQINYLLVDDFDNVWLGAEKGLGRLNTLYGIQNFWSEEIGVPLTRVNAMCFDREGSLWISTGRSGLIRIKKSAVRNIGTDEGLSFAIINTVVERDGLFYVGTDDGTIDIIGAEKVASIKLGKQLKSAGIRDIAFDKEGTMWVASYSGLLQNRGGSTRLITAKDGLPAEDVRRILVDKNNQLWVGTRTGGIAVLREGKVVNVYNRENGLSSNYILAIEKSGDGKIVVGTHSGGLNIIDQDGNSKVYHLREDDSGVLIFNIHMDESGNLWIVSNLGLFSFKDGKFTQLVFDDRFKGETFFDWIEDERGHVWVTTNIGILNFSKQSVLDFLTGRVKSIARRIYDDSDGMTNKECTGATRSWLSSTGEVWVPTLEGITIVNPTSIQKNELVPPVYVTSFIADGRPLPRERVVEVPPGTIRNVIRFTALSLMAPAKVKLKYQLVGVDKDWIDVASTREAEYTNLPPGSYKFRVIACNNDGVWNEQGATLQIRVQPFFYQTWAFFIVVGVLSLLTIYVIVRLRLRSVEIRNRELHKVNSELDRFVYSASHDLRAPLTSILGLVSVFRMDNSPENKEMYLSKIEHSVRKLDDFIHDIIDFSRNARLEVQTSKINFEKLIHDCFDDLMYLDKDNQIERRVKVEGVTTPFYSDPKRIRVILGNLISNAVRYHNLFQEKPYISVEAIVHDKDVTIKVEDNGKGISPDHIDHIFKMFYRADEGSKGSGLGLYIVKEAIAKIKGTIRVSSVQHKGTIFTIQLPSLEPPKQPRA